ncbi:MAG TPA: hypothetical protein VFS67_19795 [Polyangiaceae bacterium]|nr:hypothetical protein [Polyangiaceae bacterium]
MSKHLPSHRCITGPLLLAALTCAGCGSTDGSMLLLPAAGSGGSGSGGAAAAGAAGTGGSGGSAEPADAGPDAASDASSPAPSCVAGPLAQYCATGAGACPATYAEARVKSHEKVLALRPALILQEACSAPDGSPRIRVSTVYYGGLLSRSYIFDPDGERLVSVQIMDDLGGCADGSGSERGFHGENLPGCFFNFADVEVPPQCNIPPNWAVPDAGAALDAGADAGTAPYECILAP